MMDRSGDLHLMMTSPAHGPHGLDANAILSAVGTAVYEWSVPSDVLTWSANAGMLLGVTGEALATGRAFANLLATGSARSRFEAVVNSGQVDQGDGVPYQLEYAIEPHPGTVLWIEDTGRWHAAADGRPLRAHGVVRVVNERHEQVQRLAEASEVDALTGQMSRNRLCDVTAEALEDAHKVRGSIGFLIASIDNLSRLNEAYGFETADEVIVAVSKRLRTRMRGGDVLGRLSGNKFGILMRNCGLDDVTTAGQRMVATVGDDVFETTAGPVVVSVTVGAVIAPRHAQTLHQVLTRAQEALDGVKALRRGAFALFQPNLERDQARRDNVRITDEIVQALNDRRVKLAFQPIVSSSGSGEASSYECLVRIRRSDGTLVPAASVVPLAEKLGLVRLIDIRVLELAIAELAEAPGVHLSVNVSPTTMMDRDWITLFEAHLRAHPALAERLMVEITESSAIASLEETRQFVARVKDMGSRVAIDDFGAGYTSFRNLRRLGVDCVKIDGAFVENFDRSDDDRHFVETLLGLAQHMKLRTVAEWVQNDAVARDLKDLGCDFFQGFHTGKATESRPWLETVKTVKTA